MTTATKSKTTKPNGTASKTKPRATPPRKPKPKEKTTKPGSAKSTPRAKPAAVDSGGGTVQLEIRKIEPSPTNPRQDFDPKALEQLAASVKNLGVLQNLTVRPLAATVGGRPVERYEIICGERRWRAAKLAGLQTVPAVIADVTDEEAIEMQALENLDREDLNPIETARAYNQLLGTGYTQRALAQRLKVSQGHIGNTVRLLELPVDWQKQVISGGITATMARAVARWAKYPAVLDRLDHDLGVLEGDVDGWSQNEWEDEVSGAVFFTGCRLSGAKFTITDELREQLQIEKLTPRYGGGEVELVMNTELFDRLQAEAEPAKRNGKPEGATATATSSTPAESLADQRRKEREAAAKFNKRLWLWKMAWLQSLVAECVPAADNALLLKLLVHFAMMQPGGTFFDQRCKELRDAIVEAGGKPGKSSRNNTDWWTWIGEFETASVATIVKSAVSRWVTHDVEHWGSDMRADVVLLLVDALEIDVAASWVLTREFLELHNKSQLQELVEEWRILGKVREAHSASYPALQSSPSTRDDWIGAILTAAPEKIPQSVLEVNAP